MRKKSLAALSVLVQGVGSAFTQIVALLVLNAGEYGVFSAFYLGFAMSISFMLSSVAEAWARRHHEADPSSYLRTSSFIAVVFAALTFAAGLVVGVDLLPALIAGAGVYGSAMWSSSRYRLLVELAWRKMTISDGAGLAVAVLVLVSGFALEVRALVVVLAVWAAYGWVALAVARTFAVPSPRTAVRWFAIHRKEIATLLPDSLLLDLGSIGTPLLLFPLMSAAPFGVYRAISNVAFPVRIMMSSVRPLLGRLALSRARRLDTAALLGTCSVLLGVAAGICVILVDIYLPFLGVIADLRPYAVHAGVFVASTTFNTTVYVFCRLWAPRSRLMLGRLLQTIMMVSAPLIGFFTFSVQGAITGFVVGAVLICLVWFGVLRSLPDAAAPR